MYEQFFRLKTLPFSNTPDPRFFFKTPEHEEALARMTYCAQYHKGLLVVTGEAGTGKTLLVRLFLDETPRLTSVALILQPQLSTHELLREICREFGMSPGDNSSVAELVFELQQYLVGQRASGQHPLVIIDEANLVPMETFDALRMLSNIESSDSKLVDVFLLGQPELQERLLHESVRQLHQRVFSTIRLRNLSESATAEYIQFRLAVAGHEGNPLFSAEASYLVYQYSQGIPRVINQVCDNALLTAFSAGESMVTRELVGEVIEQMLPHVPGAGLAAASQASNKRPAETDERENVAVSGRMRIQLNEVQGTLLETQSVCQEIQAVTREAGFRANQLRRQTDFAAQTLTGLEDSTRSGRSTADALNDGAERLRNLAEKAEQTVRKLNEARERALVQMQQVSDIADLFGRVEGSRESLIATQKMLRERVEDMETKLERISAARIHAKALVDELANAQVTAEKTARRTENAGVQALDCLGRLEGCLERARDLASNLAESNAQAQGVIQTYERTAAESREQWQQLSEWSQRVGDFAEQFPRIDQVISEGRTLHGEFQNAALVLSERLSAAQDQLERLDAVARQADRFTQQLEKTHGEVLECNRQAVGHIERIEALMATASEVIEHLPAINASAQEMASIDASAGRTIAVLRQTLRGIEERLTSFESTTRESRELRQQLEATLSALSESNELARTRLNEVRTVIAETSDVLQHLPEVKEVVETLRATDAGARETAAILNDHLGRGEKQLSDYQAVRDEAAQVAGKLESCCGTAMQLDTTVQERTDQLRELVQSVQPLMDGLPSLHEAAQVVNAATVESKERLADLKSGIYLAEKTGEHLAETIDVAGQLGQNLRQSSEDVRAISQVAGTRIARLQELSQTTTGLVERLPEAQGLLGELQKTLDGSRDSNETGRQLIEQAGEISERLGEASRQARETGETALAQCGRLTELTEVADGLIQQTPHLVELANRLDTIQNEGAACAETLGGLVDQADVRIHRVEDLADSTRGMAEELERTFASVEAANQQAASGAQGLQTLMSEVAGLLDRIPEARTVADRLEKLHMDSEDRSVRLESAIESGREVINRTTELKDWLGESGGTIRRLIEEASLKSEMLTNHLKQASDEARSVHRQTEVSAHQLQALLAAGACLVDRIPQATATADRIEKLGTESEARVSELASAVECGKGLINQAREVSEQLGQRTGQARDLLEEVSGGCERLARLNEVATALVGQTPVLKELTAQVQDAQTTGNQNIVELRGLIEQGAAQIEQYGRVRDAAGTLVGDLERTSAEAEAVHRQTNISTHQLQALVAAASVLVGRIPQVDEAADRLANLEAIIDARILHLESTVNRVAEIVERCESVAQQAKDLTSRLEQARENAIQASAGISEKVLAARPLREHLDLAVTNGLGTLHQIESHLAGFRDQRQQIAADFDRGRQTMDLVATAQQAIEKRLLETQRCQATAAQQAEQLQRQLDQLEQHREVIESAGAGIARTAEQAEACERQLKNLKEEVTKAKGKVVALLAEPDRITATVQNQIRQLKGISGIARKLVTTLSKVSLDTNARLTEQRFPFSTGPDGEEKLFALRSDRSISLEGQREVRLPKRRLAGLQEQLISTQNR